MNVKQGDLATTTVSYVPGNSGRIVEVVRWHGIERGRPCWWIRSAGSPMKNSGGESRIEGYFPDAYLRPVSGLPDAESTDQEDEAVRKLKKQSSDHVAGGSKVLIPEEA